MSADAIAALKEKHAALLRDHEDLGAHIAALVKRKAAVAADLNNVIGAARLFGEELSLPLCPRAIPLRLSNGSPTIRDYVLAQLEASATGCKAGDLRAAYRQTYGISVHPKTFGMTLYRLMRQGLARREGRIWHWAQVASDEVEGQGFALHSAKEP